MSMMSSEMMKAGMTGRGFKVLQVQGDLLWYTLHILYLLEIYFISMGTHTASHWDERG